MTTNAPAELEGQALGLAESVVMGVAGTAPAFSIAATTATLIGAVGLLAPASLLYCGLIMFGVTFAYLHLNRLNPSAGAAYAWVGAIFNRTLGFFAGWALLVASVVFMVSGTIPAATATLTLVAPGLAVQPAAVALVAAGWLLVVSAVIVKGIKLTSYSQIVMTVTEAAILLALMLLALAKYGAHPAHGFSLVWLSPGSFTPQLFATGALTALFFFWGWDVTVNLTEETRDASRAPGHGALWAMLIVLALFMGFAVVILLVLNDEEIQQSSTNVVFAIADKLLPRPWSYVAVIAVMLSTVGTLETSILQFTRTLYAKGRDGIVHPRYAILHKRWRTPWVATAMITAIGLLLLFGASYFPSVSAIIKDSVNAIGFQVAFYYGLAGFACAWRFRREALRSVFNLVFLLVWPLFSALFLWFIAVYSVPTFDLATNVVGLGGIALGVVPLMLNRRMAARAAAG
ncbi:MULTISPECIES: APC family permease [Ralstonia solanacearum species complex]|uniref:Amino acid transporter transmembrane protein n=1 Tax=Ralstonia solanacearum TaxID=305 RepID=A0A0S4VXC5_RALSL|nr:APC family permease [Ralstonia pseudosolanacearum]CUV24447.1 Amino acid transporter transmembrane protein [Ralstonia solanacearum]CUV35607.1 Amino acid transporter transmembrane protein [Ralstonia solanacearum]CUV39099.1 Amino acid transporter transmembrane protein [Ralstonia solanacearum]CUV59304.1 Amino acid transporter transmembrane protein [Ralstonia solanacearum]